eukprot:gene4027-9061_t
MRCLQKQEELDKLEQELSAELDKELDADMDKVDEMNKKIAALRSELGVASPMAKRSKSGSDALTPAPAAAPPTPKGGRSAGDPASPATPKGGRPTGDPQCTCGRGGRAWSEHKAGCPRAVRRYATRGRGEGSASG